ncbi:MAG: M24 family metallopeptidase [Planctomycetota bacterium]|jgi:Xaa-Pro aminopeptidase
MNPETIKKRIKSIRHRLSKKKINCLIITKPASVTYATGFLGDDSWAAITNRGLWLLTDSRYTEQAAGQCPHCRIVERTGPMTEAAAQLVKKQKSLKTVTVEKSISLVAFEALKKTLKNRIKTVADIIEELRSIKDKSEIAAIKKAAQIAAQALKQTQRYIRAGVTENELAGMLDFQIRKLGAINSFTTIAAFGANASLPHYQPGGRKLKKNDTVLIDFGVRYKGYCSDITRCFVVGRPSAFYKKVYNAVDQAQAAALKIVKAGVQIKKVDAAARKVIAKHDLPVYGHGTGHGLGLEVHESPIVAAKTKGRLKAGQVITIEPGVYIPGKSGVRIEDDVLVTGSGYRILSSNCPRRPLPA